MERGLKKTGPSPAETRWDSVEPEIALGQRRPCKGMGWRYLCEGGDPKSKIIARNVTTIIACRRGGGDPFPESRTEPLETVDTQWTV